MIAGGGVRAVLELAGIRDILAKSLGTTNPINMLKATVNALQSLKRPEEVARIRGKTIEDVLPLKKRNGEDEALRITQTRSQIGQSERHRGTLRALGLGKIGRTADHRRAHPWRVCSGRSATS